MAASIYDQYTLIETMRVQKVIAPQYWLTLYPTVINFTTPEIAFDKVFGDDRKLAPFVVPNVQGRPQSLVGYETRAFKPAYSKIKDVVDETMFIPRMAGEALGSGSLSINQRRDAQIAELLRLQKVRHRNTQEWLAARATIDGKVTISGEDYPTTLVDFRRDPSLTGALAGAAKWDQATADPLGDLADMRSNAYEISGVIIRKWIFGANAWKLLAQRVDLREQMNKFFGGFGTNVTLLSDGLNETMEFMGVIEGSTGGGRIEAWVNTARYIDPEDGTEKFMLDQNTVVGVSESIQGVRCFGAIRDAAAQYQAVEFFAKNWIEQDPSVEYLLSQSAPLMVPKNPDASCSIKVA